MAGEKFPSWLKGRIGEAEAARVREAVDAAEKRCDAEIVPLIVRRSSAVGQVPMVTALLLMVIGAIFLLAWRDHLHDEALLVAVFGGIFVCAIAAWPLSGLAWVQRMTIPDADEVAQVERRAIAEFALQRISATRRRRGILLMVSVMERRAVILPDEGLRDVLTPETCAALVTGMAADLREGRWAQAFTDVIARIPGLPGIPVSNASGNEIGNGLTVKE